MKKAIISVVVALSLTLSLGLSACSNGDGGQHTHNWVEVNSTASCGEAGVTEYQCECGETKTEQTSASGKHTYDGIVCKTCGYVDFSGMTVGDAIEEYGYYLEDKDSSNTYSTGDLVYFGSYPQNRVEDAAQLSALGEQAGILPTADDAGDWTDYGYYSEGELHAYAFYKDVTVNGNKYRGVYLLNYRPYYSGLAAGENYSYIDNEGYELEAVYWFEYAPVVWNVLEYNDGSLFLSSKYNVEAQPFQDTYEAKGADYIVPDTDEYVNNWKYSSVRSFLNGEFYENAFDELQQVLIQTVTLNNVASGYSDTAEFQVNQQNTEDRVFLMSYEDVNNTAFGYTAKGSTRIRSYTDYSVIQGLRTSSESSTADGEPACFYTLRSAGTKSFGVCGVSKNGSVSSSTPDYSDESVDGLAINGTLGVLPALRIRVGKAAQGGWKDFTYEYTDEAGKNAEATCSVYVPASYVGGTSLPLITYIGDSSYTSATLEQYKSAQCPKAWITDEKMTAHPTFFLVILGSPSASLTVSVIDKVVADYGMDENRLYLTGQSMGGITDFLLNDTFPEKFAATVYVDCQPGGEVHDEQYDSIIANAKFVGQKFVYIASRMDQLAAQGQDDVEQVLKDNDITYGKLYDLDHKDTAALNAAIKAVLDEGRDQNFFGFRQVTSSGNTAAEHMQSFQYGYSVDAIFEWLVAQHK